jgi:hypothetical protein
MVFIFAFFPKNGSDTTTNYHSFSIICLQDFVFTTISLRSPPRFKEKKEYLKMSW